MQRKCVCGAMIAINSQLCSECRRKYGKQVDWPEWLSDWMVSYQKELDRENLHQDLEIFDESSAVEAAKLNLYMLDHDEVCPDTEFDEWGNQVEVVNEFNYVDMDAVIACEKSFERKLRWLSNLSPQEKAKRRKACGME